MNFGWETEKEKILRGAKIDPGRKLEAFRELNEFTDKFLSKQTKKIRQKLRETR